MKYFFVAGTTVLLTLLAVSFFPSLNQEAFKVGTFSVLGYYIFGLTFFAGGSMLVRK